MYDPCVTFVFARSLFRLRSGGGRLIIYHKCYCRLLHAESLDFVKFFVRVCTKRTVDQSDTLMNAED